jgi:hypothetical protein
VKKQLLARSEDELFPAINALQDTIGKFHGRLPRTQGNDLNRPCLKNCRPVPCLVRLSQHGPGPRRGAAQTVFPWWEDRKVAPVETGAGSCVRKLVAASPHHCCRAGACRNVNV